MATLLFFGLCIFYIANANAGTKPKPQSLKEVLQTLSPSFRLKVLNPSASGYNYFSLRNFGGHVVIINFWATWCPPCRAEIPVLEKFYNAYKPKGVVVVGINVNSNMSGVKSFTKRYGITYPVVYANSNIISNYGGVNEIPQTFFISKSGKIMFHYIGEISKGALYGITVKLLSMRQ